MKRKGLKGNQSEQKGPLAADQVSNLALLRNIMERKKKRKKGLSPLKKRILKDRFKAFKTEEDRAVENSAGPKPCSLTTTDNHGSTEEDLAAIIVVNVLHLVSPEDLEDEEERCEMLADVQELIVQPFDSSAILYFRIVQLSLNEGDSRHLVVQVGFLNEAVAMRAVLIIDGMLVAGSKLVAFTSSESSWLAHPSISFSLFGSISLNEAKKGNMNEGSAQSRDIRTMAVGSAILVFQNVVNDEDIAGMVEDCEEMEEVLMDVVTLCQPHCIIAQQHAILRATLESAIESAIEFTSQNRFPLDDNPLQAGSSAISPAATGLQHPPTASFFPPEPWVFLECPNGVAARRCVALLSEAVVCGSRVSAALFDHSDYKKGLIGTCGIIPADSSSPSSLSAASRDEQDSPIVVVGGYLTEEDLLELTHCSADEREEMACVLKSDLLKLLRRNLPGEEAAAESFLVSRIDLNTHRSSIDSADSVVKIESGGRHGENEVGFYVCVEFSDLCSAEQAMVALDGAMLGGQRIRARVFAASHPSRAIPTTTSMTPLHESPPMESTSALHSGSVSLMNALPFPHRNPTATVLCKIEVPCSRDGNERDVAPPDSPPAIESTLMGHVQIETIHHENLAEGRTAAGICSRGEPTAGTRNTMAESVFPATVTGGKTSGSVPVAPSPAPAAAVVEAAGVSGGSSAAAQAKKGAAVSPSLYLTAAKVPKVAIRAEPRHAATVPTADAETNDLVKALLLSLSTFQLRAKEVAPVKAKFKPRFLVGMRQIARALKLGKVKMLLVAPNTEALETVDHSIDSLLYFAEFGRELPMPIVITPTDISSSSSSAAGKFMTESISNPSPIAHTALGVRAADSDDRTLSSTADDKKIVTTSSVAEISTAPSTEATAPVTLATAVEGENSGAVCREEGKEGQGAVGDGSCSLQMPDGKHAAGKLKNRRKNKRATAEETAPSSGIRGGVREGVEEGGTSSSRGAVLNSKLGPQPKTMRKISLRDIDSRTTSAPGCDRADGSVGGLAGAGLAEEYWEPVPALYCLSRRLLGKALQLSMKQVVVAVMDPDGAYDSYKKILRFIEREKRVIAIRSTPGK